ncbi:MAG: DUF3857 domain-containing protein [Deltaproteobacteria bacterium]|nr:DUF3857 domain-containing protein [Candidatus Anaeroferrophillus wilburensis]MBN2888937.1 DUF3857 domain-containing protein [Deltaproteobacteria bacterium]
MHPQRHSNYFLRLVFVILLFATLGTSAARGTTSSPPADWLQDADALTLLIDKRYTVNQNGSYDLQIHVVRKIITYKGKKNYADFKLAYNDSYQSVTIEKAETTTPEGSVIAADTGEVHDILAPWTANASIHSHSRQKIVNLPSVVPGATIDIELTLHSRLGFWAEELFRLDDPISKKSVSVTVPDSLSLYFREPAGISGTKQRHENETTTYCWEAVMLPKQVPEQLTPRSENQDFSLLLSTFGSWQQVSSWYADRIAPSAGTLTALNLEPFALEISTVDRLYESLMRQITPNPISFLATDLTPQPAAETLAQGYGTPADLALLFYQVLQHLRIPATLLWSNTSGIFLTDLSAAPSPELLSNPLVRCRSKDYSFERQELPPGFTGCEDQLALSMADGSLVPVITSYPNQQHTKMDISLTAENQLAGSIKTVLSGEAAVDARKQWRYLSPEERQITASRFLHAIDPLAVIDGSLTTSGLEELQQPVIIECRFTIPRTLPMVGGYSLFTIPTPALPGEFTTCLPDRRTALMIDTPFADNLELTISLPAMSTCSTIPLSTAGELPGITWETTAAMAGNHLLYNRTIELKRTILPADSTYQQFRRQLVSFHQPMMLMVLIKPEKVRN